MRAILVLGTLATLVALGGSLPPKDKDKGDNYDLKHDNGHGNDYGSDHDHADSKPDSKSGFHIAEYNPLNVFTRQPSPGCDDYSAGLCGCFCHYQGYPYYICAKDHCQCYGGYVTGCWYAYYYYIGGGYPAPGDWHQPRYPHCPRYPYCSESPYSSVTPTYVSDGPTMYTPLSSTSMYNSSSPYESASSVYSSTTPYPSSSEYPSSTPYQSSNEYPSSTLYQSSSEYPSTTAYVTSSEYYPSAEYTSTAIQGPSPSSS